MSKPRYSWWGYVKNILRRYPQIKAEYENLLSMKITPTYSADLHSSEASRTVENITIKAMTSGTAEEYDAVTKTIEQTKAMPDGTERIQLIDMIFWKQTHTLHGAAMKQYLSYVTVKRRYEDFIKTVAKNRGLL